jgi:hypothetical protein
MTPDIAVTTIAVNRESNERPSYFYAKARYFPMVLF